MFYQKDKDRPLKFQSLHRRWPDIGSRKKSFCSQSFKPQSIDRLDPIQPRGQLNDRPHDPELQPR